MDKSTLQEIRAAEAAAQRSVCVIPDGDLPDDLAKALERRVEVNAAQHQKGRPVARVGSTDDEVLALEHPYRVTTLANPTETPDDKPRRVKKTAANKAAANTEGN